MAAAEVESGGQEKSLWEKRIKLGLGTAEDERLLALQRQAEQGDPGAQADLCTKFMDDQISGSQALKWCREAAGRGDAEAQFTLGVILHLGHGGPHDNSEAVKWYYKAAKQGHPRAQATLGGMYIGGDGGLPVDYAEALRWVLRAAEQSDRLGQAAMGTMYARGLGVEQDLDEAAKWLLRAVSHLDAEEQTLALFNTGDMYAEGRHMMPQSHTEAAKWYPQSRGARSRRSSIQPGCHVR